MLLAPPAPVARQKLKPLSKGNGVKNIVIDLSKAEAAIEMDQYISTNELKEASMKLLVSPQSLSFFLSLPGHLFYLRL
jgi:hypothetical protein